MRKSSLTVASVEDVSQAVDSGKKVNTSIRPFLLFRLQPSAHHANGHQYLYSREMVSRLLTTTTTYATNPFNLSYHLSCGLKQLWGVMETVKSTSCASIRECARQGPPPGVANEPSPSPDNVTLHTVTPASRSNSTKGSAELDTAPFSPGPTYDTTDRHRPNLPPPPKVGEKLRPMEDYAPRNVAGVQGRHQHTRSLQMPPASPRPWSIGGSIGGPTEVSYTPNEEATETISTRSRAKSMAERTRKGTIEHPAGYVQNPYALEMSPEHRFAIEQEDQLEQTLPVPSCTPSRRPSTASSILGESIEQVWKRVRRGSIIGSAPEWLEWLSETS